MASDGSIKITTELDNASAQKALGKFSKIAKAGCKGVAVAVATVGTALTVAAGYAIQTGIEFESAFAGVKKTVNASADELDNMRQGIRDMSKDIPQSAAAIASVAEAAGQLGIQNKSILSFTRTMSDLGVATNMSATEAATSLARLANITQMPQENFDRLGSVVVELGNNLATTESEITEMGLRLAGAGKQVGMSEAKIMGLAAAISSVGIEADAGGSAVSTVMAKMQLAVERGGGSLAEFAAVAGMTGEEFRAAFEQDAAQALVAFVTGLGTMESKGQSAIATLDEMGITEIRQRDALLRLSGAGDILSDSLSTATQAWDENNALTKEAEQRYQTLESRIQILKNNVADFGITIYDGMRTPLSNTVDEGIRCVERLQSAFESGGVKAAVSELGASFNDVMDDIAGTSDAAAGIVGPLRNVASAGATIAKTVFPPLAKVAGTLAENLDVVIPLLVSGATAMKGYSAAKSAVSAVKGLSKAYNASAAALDLYIAANGVSTVATAASTGALTLKQVAVGFLTKQLGLATAAHAAFNAVVNANPVALAVTAVAALAAGLVAYGITADDSSEKSYKLSEGQKKVIDTCREATNALNEQRAAREESVQSIDMEYDGYKSLVTELQSITDANGNVKAGYEERAKIITGELSSALGIEIELLDGQIQKYGEVVTAIEEVITKKKAEALCAALQDEMATAYKDSQKAMKAYGEAVNVAEEKEKALTSAKENLKKVEEEWGNNTGPKAIASTLKAEEAVKSAQKAYDKASESVDSAKTSLNELSTEVNNYDALVAAMAGGSTAEIEAAMNALLSGYQSYSAEMLATSQTAQNEMLSQAKSNTGALQMLIDEGGAMYQAFGDDAANAAAKAVSEFQKLPGGVKAAVEAIGPKASGAMVSALAQANLDGLLSEESKASYKAFLAGLDGLDEGTKQALSDAAEGAMQGMDDFEKISKMAEEQGISFLDALRISLDEHSPSKATEEIFRLAMEGAAIGVDSGKEGVLTKAGEFITSFLGKFTEGGIGEKIQGIGEKVMSFFGIGVSSQQEGSKAAGKANADAANQGAGSVNPSGTGGLFGTLFGGGVGSMVASLFGKGKGLSDSADSGAGSVDPSGTGGLFGLLFGSGVGSKTKEAEKKGESLADNAEAGAGTADGETIGSDFGSGFVKGIGSWISKAATKAAELAKSAYDAAKELLDINSPSKETRRLGRWFSQGFAGGIEEEAKAAAEASEKLAEGALDSISLEDMRGQLQSLDVPALAGLVYASIDSRNETVGAKVSAPIIARQQAGRFEDATELHLSERDMERLGKAFGSIASELMVEGLSKSGLFLEMYGEKVGRLATPSVDREMSVANMKARRNM